MLFSRKQSRYCVYLHFCCLTRSPRLRGETCNVIYKRLALALQEILSVWKMYILWADHFKGIYGHSNPALCACNFDKRRYCADILWRSSSKMIRFRYSVNRKTFYNDMFSNQSILKLSSTKKHENFPAQSNMRKENQLKYLTTLPGSKALEIWRVLLWQRYGFC